MISVHFPAAQAADLTGTCVPTNLFATKVPANSSARQHTCKATLCQATPASAAKLPYTHQSHCCQPASTERRARQYLTRVLLPSSAHAQRHLKAGFGPGTHNACTGNKLKAPHMPSYPQCSAEHASRLEAVLMHAFSPSTSWVRNPDINALALEPIECMHVILPCLDCMHCPWKIQAALWCSPTLSCCWQLPKTQADPSRCKQTQASKCLVRFSAAA